MPYDKYQRLVFTYCTYCTNIHDSEKVPHGIISDYIDNYYNNTLKNI